MLKRIRLDYAPTGSWARVVKLTEMLGAEICGPVNLPCHPSLSIPARGHIGWRIVIGARSTLATHEPALASPNHAPRATMCYP